jgi:zinc protease
MIKYQEHILSNGLTLITHVDKSTPLAVVNILYKAGSRNEHPERTGFAHLFEHLMFNGSKNIPDFDKILQKVGAENNAFTNTDITNYYVILSAENIETALWAESDRMQFLNLDEKSLENQKNVVIEEFKQRYLNVPFGDVWLKLQPLAYHVHPYQWPTIGKNISHIEEATLKDVKEFHEQFYVPNNAVLTISGNIDPEKTVTLVEKWFGNIPGDRINHMQIPAESRQTSSRFLEIEENVPLDSVYKAFHMPGRKSNNYYSADLLSDLLGRGKSSRLYQSLVKNDKVFNSINSYVTGTEDPGLLIISGKVNPDIDIVEAEKAIEEEINILKNSLEEREVEKVINQAISSTYFSEAELLNRSINLSVANSMGNTNLVNEELELVGKVKRVDILDMADEILKPQNCSTLYYKSDKK